MANLEQLEIVVKNWDVTLQPHRPFISLGLHIYEEFVGTLDIV